MDNSGKNNSYSEASFWEKLKKFALQAGKDVTEKALILFYAYQQKETPLWAKTVIVGALSYFILPTDAIPDIVPLTGYSDDLGALAAALLSVAMCITPEVKELAKKKTQDWFSHN
ncbi:YkvA family protein [Chlorogloea sp. CCALA 695]|uniref:YkvA family protein n=1 Tax=Chlorogloea sp. CCALA 695 TaxID=2107693 RepID=UPI000D081A07|nr:YkvA family protein [Chlorogloea sp. CCALA 695]PSB33442.1 hypothetical protein C7B70_06240 [Chlorogloea sp. CCALA 695]